MDGFNQVILVGNIGADPEFIMTQTGQGLLKLRVATTDSYLDRDNVRKEVTDWHSITVWGKRAEALEKILHKGQQVFVTGQLKTDSYEDKDGEKRYKTYVKAVEIIIPPKGGGGGGGRDDRDRRDSRDEGRGRGGRDDERRETRREDRGGERDRGGRDERPARREEPRREEPRREERREPKGDARPARDDDRPKDSPARSSRGAAEEEFDKEEWDR